MDLGPILLQVVLLLVSAVAVLLLAAKLRIPPVVGLLVTGMVIGPSGFGVLGEVEQVEPFAEIGVALLLFIIGLELSLAKLREMSKVFFVGGGTQAALTAALVTGGAALLGLRFPAALFFGFAVALSSTAVVLKILGDRQETDTPHGRVILGILLFQDFLIVPLIVLTPVLGGAVPFSIVDLAVRFGGSLVAIGLVVVVARKAVPALFHRIARTRARETFVLGALAACFGMAWLTHSFEFSLALGAFLAGLIVSESEYSHQVVADVAPFRDLFASVFFISVGMLVDIAFALNNLAAIAGLTAAVLLLKVLATGVAASVAGYPGRVAVLTALSLAQVGEFSFVLMEVGRTHGLLSGGRYQLLLSAAVVTLILTPLLVRWAPALAERWPGGRKPRPDQAHEEEEKLTDHVVVVGFGLNGQLVARVLREDHIPYRVLELNPDRVRQAREDGEPIVYGDATRPEILEAAGVQRARVVVFAIADRRALFRAVALVRQLAENVEIIVRTRMVDDIEELTDLGANQVVAEEFETAIEVLTRVLERYHVPRNVLRAQTRALRGEGYRMLRARSMSEGVSDTVMNALEGGTTDIYRIEPNSPAAGRTLREVDLRGRTGATVIAVVREEEPRLSPSADTRLEVGDSLVLVGGHSEIENAYQALEAPRRRGGEPERGDRQPGPGDRQPPPGDGGD